jgi:Raf kinase inhibitor-like YbhB/YbcL family protein
LSGAAELPTMATTVPRRAVLAGVAAAVAGCGGPAATTATEAGTTRTTAMSELTVTSPAFEDGAPIPERYGKAFENVNPPLRVAGVSEGTASLALVVDDPDAPGGTFDHWLAWNLPPGTTEIPEGWDPPADVVQGTNDFGNVGYDGPRPPEEHTYRFRVVALDTTLGLVQGADGDDLTAAMDGHVLARGTLRGTFAP